MANLNLIEHILGIIDGEVLIWQINYQLVLDNLTHSHHLETPTLIQQHNLSLSGLTHSHSIPNISLTQVHNLLPANMTHGLTIANITSVTNFAGSGTGWNYSERITADDSSYANKLVSQDFDSMQLIGYNFGFSIPDGATINGVVVTINAKASSADNIALQNGDAGVTLGSWDGLFFTANGDKKTDANLWTKSDVDYTLGTSSDTWGATLSPSDINDSTFAIKILVHAVNNNATAYVDAVKITVYYTVSDLQLIQNYLLQIQNILISHLIENIELEITDYLSIQDLSHAVSIDLSLIHI